MNALIRKYLQFTVSLFLALTIVSTFACANKKRALQTEDVDNVMYKEDVKVDTNLAEGKEMLAAGSSKRMLDSQGSVIQNIVERRLIKTGYINFEAENIKESRFLINNLMSKYEAYINNESEESTARMIEQNLVIKIPKNNFDAFLANLEQGVRKISSKSIDIQDVTEEFIDITARLKVKKEAEQTYIRLLSTAKTAKDVLDIQEQIQDIRSEIESIEGRIRYLENAVSYCTVNIHMYQYISKGDSFPRASFFTRLLSSIKSGIHIFLEVIIGIFHAWVFILIAIILGVVLKLYHSKKRRAKNEHK